MAAGRAPLSARCFSQAGADTANRNKRPLTTTVRAVWRRVQMCTLAGVCRVGVGEV